jgi:hypothetical protein
MDNVGCKCDLIGQLRRPALHQTWFQSKEYEDSLRGKAGMSSSLSDTKSTGSVGGLTKRQRDKEVTPASSNIRCCYFVSVTCYEGDMLPCLQWLSITIRCFAYSCNCGEHGECLCQDQKEVCQCHVSDWLHLSFCCPFLTFYHNNNKREHSKRHATYEVCFLISRRVKYVALCQAEKLDNFIYKKFYGLHCMTHQGLFNLCKANLVIRSP